MWYKRRKVPFLILAIISLLFLYFSFQQEFTSSGEEKYISYSIEFMYKGVDAQKIERTITEPLEERLKSLEGLYDFDSIIDYEKSKTIIRFCKSAGLKKSYLSLRNLVYELYDSLPEDVQKPRITSWTDDNSSLICLAFPCAEKDFLVRSWLKANLVPKLENLEGVSEVIVSGGEEEEVRVLFDTEQLVFLSRSPADLASSIKDSNLPVPETELLYFDTRLHSLDELREVPVADKGNYATLGAISSVEKRNCEESEYVKLNGENCISLEIKNSYGANKIKLSRECGKVISSVGLKEKNYNVLYDKGKNMKENIKSLLISIGLSLLLIIVFLPFFFNDLFHVLLDIHFLLLSLVWQAGIMSLCSIPLNEETLSAIGISIGLVSDSFFVMGKCKSISEVKEISPSVFASVMTSSLVLLPVYFLEDLIPGVKNLSLTILCMMFSSFFLSVIFYPCFLLNRKNNLPILSDGIFLPVRKTVFFWIRRTVSFSLNKSKVLFPVILFLSLSPFVIFFMSGKNLSVKESFGMIPVSIEFDSNLKASSVEQEIKDFVTASSKLKEVDFVLSSCKKGNARLRVVYDKNKSSSSEICPLLNELSELVQDGFVFVPQVKSKSKRKVHTVSVAVIGKESCVCRDYAKKISAFLLDDDFFDSLVLNFKEDEKEYVLYPRIDFLTLNNYSVRGLGETLRWILYGPVADKWILEGSERDIRIMGDKMEKCTLEKVSSLKIPLPVDSLGTFVLKEGSGRIFRKDGRRAAFFTVEFSKKSLSSGLDYIRDKISQVEMSDGYYIYFPKELETIKETYLKLFIVFLLCAIGVFILISMLTEKLFSSFCIVLLIPLSVFLPLLLRFFSRTSLECGDVMGMVLLSGITVNSGIYLAGRKIKSIKYRIFFHLPDLLLTSVTSVAGCIPLLLLSDSFFSSKLAFFFFWGILFSLLAIFLFFPVLMKAIVSEKKN